MLGTPEEIHKKIEAFRDVGVDQMIVSFERGRELEGLKIFGEGVSKNF
jgi:propanediol dehydratase small subunit